MSLRDQRQEEFADVYLKSKGEGILDLCPRFGKIRCSINILRKLGVEPKILISYPEVNIKKEWQSEFKKVKYKNKNIEFCTHLSLHKYSSKSYDIVIIDEIHLLSERQIEAVQDIILNNKRILGLTGTLSSWTERTLGKRLGLNVLARYSIDTAIQEGVVTDYRITVKIIPLDDTVKNTYKSATRTEKGQFDAYGAVIRRLEEENKETFYLRLARMRIIQNSIAKIKATKEILKKFSAERVLIFCGIIKTAESLGCPVLHSKSGSTAKVKFEEFCKGKGNHMAVVKIGNTGITYKPLDKVVINYFDSNSENLAQKINRCMAIEYNTPNKVADIWITCSNEPVELNWLNKALEFFDKKKINFIT